tara:strand:+ start:762 stop:1046 length:285 start_codon:yes stop_codon:yes gene_type:complete
MKKKINFDNKEFKKLVKKQNFLSYSFSFLILLVYFTFIIIIGFKPNIFSFFINDSKFTVGIIYGVSIIIFSIILTIFYVLLANKILDTIRDKIK